MFAFPNSSAMDATAGSGGPSTILPQIVTGNQPAIAAHSTSLLSTATTLTSMVSEFTSAAQSLSNVWSGQASETALKKITDSLSAFTKIIQVIQNGAKLLQASGALVQTAQTGYTSVVSATNPTVASLMSNPWTYSAAVALSTGVSGALRAFITGVQGMLTGTSAVQLLQEIAALAQIATTIEQLIQGGSAASATPATAGTMPTNETISTTPVTASTTVPTIASATGQQAAQGIGVGQAAIPQQYIGTPNSTTGTGQLAGAGLGQTNGYGIPGASGASTGTMPTNLGITPPASTTAPTNLGLATPTGQLAGAGLDGSNGYGIPGASAPIGGSPTNLGLTPATGATGTMPNVGTVNPTGYMGTPNSTAAGQGLVPSTNPADSWIAVDPSQQAAAAGAGAPAAAVPAATGQNVSVTTTDGGITTTVSVPAGEAANVHLDMTVNSDHIAENLNIGADGSVSVS